MGKASLRDLCNCSSHDSNDREIVILKMVTVNEISNNRLNFLVF